MEAEQVKVESKHHYATRINLNCKGGKKEKLVEFCLKGNNQKLVIG